VIYLAAPIDWAETDEAILIRTLRTDALRALERQKVAVYDPASAFQDAHRSPAAMGVINRAALASSDGVLAIMPEGVKSVGVPIEIALGGDHFRLPVAVVGHASLGYKQLVGNITIWTEAQVRDAVDWLTDQPRQHRNVVRWTGDPGCAPVTGYPGDAGLDLVVAKDTTIGFDQFVDVDLGISVEMPPGTWGMLTGRSSTMRKRGLLVTQGIIDNGYRGPLYAGVRNLSEGRVELKRGERIAQLILLPLPADSPPPLERVPALSESHRGTNGFGSTGI
jgi:dUTP pyrophosphatase